MVATERTTVRLPKQLMKLARDKCRRENRTLTGLVEEALQNAVGLAAPRDPGKPFPVSKTAGKCLVDMSSLAAVLDALDEDLPFEKLR